MTLVFNRDRAIDALLDNDRDYIVNGDGGGLEWIESVLRGGFTGYDNMSDPELHQECLERDIPESYFFDGDDYDGQPDEAQEWHDFDPEC